jgi:integrase
VLRIALNAAVAADILAVNNVTKVRAPAEPQNRPEPWSIADGERFLAAVVGHRDEALYTLAIHFGPRQGELLALSWDDVNFERRTLTIVHTLHWVKGRPYLGPTKSKTSRRRLRLTPELVDTLRAHRLRQEREIEIAGENWNETGLVFTTPTGSARRGDVLTNQFHRLTRRLGLRQVRFHDLRRLAAGLMLFSSGGDIAGTGLMLGHSEKSRLTPGLVRLPSAGAGRQHHQRRGPRAGRGRYAARSGGSAGRTDHRTRSNDHRS